MHYPIIVWNLILHFYYVQIYTKTSLDHLHSKVHLIHTDIKPENILLVANNADEGDVRIKIIDMGSAVFGCERCDCDHDNSNNSCDGYRDGLRTSIVNTRQYRAPEILLRTGWSYPSDVWAAGERLPNAEHDNMMHQVFICLSCAGSYWYVAPGSLILIPQSAFHLLLPDQDAQSQSWLSDVFSSQQRVRKSTLQ